MLLYQYLEHPYALAAISDGQLKVSTLDKLNDPYEMMPRIIKDGIPLPVSECRKWFIDRIADRIGIICLSRRIKDPVLWAHYAARHTGMALAFTVPEGGDLIEMDYRLERVELSFDADWREQHECFLELIRAKFLSWKYEDEYRYLVAKADCVEKNGLFFYPLFRDWFSGVILGRDCPVRENAIRCVLDHAGYRNVGISRVELSDTTFEMIPRTSE